MRVSYVARDASTFGAHAPDLADGCSRLDVLVGAQQDDAEPIRRRAGDEDFTLETCDALGL
jgi:hypothetical protein